MRKTTKRRAAVLAAASAITAGLLVTPSAGAAEAHGGGERLLEFCQRSFDRTVQAYDAAFAARDLDRLMEFYREDAVKVDPNGDVQYGKEEIAVLFAQLFELDFVESFPHLYKVVDCQTASLLTDSKLVFPEWQYEENFLSSITYTFDRGRWRVLSSTSTGLTTSGG